MTGPYDDIIKLPHHVSKIHPPQPMDKRAAQFSPFAALTGYDDAVEETARYTDTKQELEEETKLAINAALHAVQSREKTHPEILLEYFVPDAQKRGGAYRTVRVSVKKVDDVQKTLTLTDGTVVPFSDVMRIPTPDPHEADR
jgi:hypothetical protein